VRRLVALLLALCGSACGPAAIRPVAPSCSPCATSLVFHNDTSATFRLVRIEVSLDGEVGFRRADDHLLPKERQLPLAENLELAPGEHTLEVVLGFRGAGTGVFSYLAGYSFTVRSSHRFAARGARLLRVHAFERAAGKLEDRLAVRFEEEARGGR